LKDEEEVLSDSVEVSRPLEAEEVSPEEQKALLDDLFNGPAPLPTYDDAVFRDNSPLHNERMRAAVNPQGFNYASIMNYANANHEFLTDMRYGCYFCKCGITENCINDIVVVHCKSEDCSSVFYHGSCLCVHFLRRGRIHCPGCGGYGSLELVQDIEKLTPAYSVF
jgi:hypothetical protein